MDKQTTFVGHQLIRLERVDSTNNYTAKVFKDGSVDSGAVILTDIQTNGRGQRDKVWHSDAFSNLIVSLAADLDLWKINNLISLNHITALSLHSFISKYVKITAIKWPNDIMVNDKKCAGILIENQISSQHKRSVIGFGVNVNQQRFDAPRATSLSLEIGEDFKLQDMIFEVIDAFNYFINLYQQKGEEYIFELYNSRLWKRRESHDFHLNDQSRNGEIISTTMHGELLVEFDGEEMKFLNGQVRY